VAVYILTHLGYNFFLYITGMRDQCLKRNYYKMKRHCCGSPNSNKKAIEVDENEKSIKKEKR
jgi:hypothetical protein